MNYQIYKLTPKEHLRCLGMAAGLSACIAYLFYDSGWGMLLFPVLYIILMKRYEAAGRERVQDQLAKQFLDVLRTVSASLLAGYSMENAWREAGKEIASLYGEDSLMGRELSEINHSVNLNIPLEKLLENLAERSGNPDIASFAEVFAFAKRSGGNFVTIMEGTANHIRARYDTEREIQVLVASKRLEQKIMNAMPMLILAYLKVTSVGFLDVLYRNPTGMLFMSGCLIAYGGALTFAEKILRIRM